MWSYKRHYVQTILFLILFSPAYSASAEVLGIPAPNSTQSGIGVISGWKCHANGRLTARFDRGDAIPLVYGSARPDTQGVCGDTNNGFVAIWNWGNMDDGTHTIVVYDNGQEFDRATFTVVTTGVEFLRGVTGSGTATLSNGQKATLEWSEATQSFVATHYTAPRQTDSRICTAKTAQVQSLGGAVATWTVTNPCDGETLDIDVMANRSEEFFLCGLEIVQDGIQFGTYSSFEWRDRNTNARICGDILPGLTKQTTVKVQEGAALNFMDPFQLYYRGVEIFTFP